METQPAAFRPAAAAALALGTALALGAFLLLGPGGCTETFNAAVGPNEDVEMFSDFPRGDERTQLLGELLSGPVQAPIRAERRFKVLRTDSTAFERMRHWRNLVLLGDMTASEWAARQSKRLLTPAAFQGLTAQSSGYLVLPDVWATGQTVLVVHARTTAALRALLEGHRDEMMARFEDGIIDGLAKTLYLSGEQAEMAAGIEDRHGIAMRIPRDFLVEEDAANRFVRVKRILPDQPVLFMFVYYEPQKLEPDDPRFPTYCMAVRDTLAQLYFGGDRVDASRTNAEWVDFQGRRALRLYGPYQNDNPPMGGPFRMYCFHEGGRLYTVDLAVFNPPGTKLPQMRILEAVARSLRLTGGGNGTPRRRA